MQERYDHRLDHAIAARIGMGAASFLEVARFRAPRATRTSTAVNIPQESPSAGICSPRPRAVIRLGDLANRMSARQSGRLRHEDLPLGWSRPSISILPVRADRVDRVTSIRPLCCCSVCCGAGIHAVYLRGDLARRSGEGPGKLAPQAGRCWRGRGAEGRGSFRDRAGVLGRARGCFRRVGLLQAPAACPRMEAVDVLVEVQVRLGGDVHSAEQARPGHVHVAGKIGAHVEH